MAKPAPFSLPEGVEFDVSGKKLDVKHAGDVVIATTLGKTLGTVEAGGDLTVRLAKVTGSLTAGGTLTIEGPIAATSLRAKRIVLGGGAIAAKAISAEESITIGAAQLQVDAIVAPHIEIDPGASGRVTVIDSRNDRKPNKVKGGFSLADYEDMIGNAEAFLAERGIPAPDGSAPAAPAPAAPAPAAAAPEPPAAPEPEEEEEEEVVLAPAPAADLVDDDEDVDDPLSLSVEDLEPLNEEEDPDAALQARLNEALRRITACYDGGPDTPPAVAELRSLVEDGDVGALSQNITSVWNGLLGFHQKRGIRPHHQVTHAFNVIHSLVS